MPFFSPLCYGDLIFSSPRTHVLSVVRWGPVYIWPYVQASSAQCFCCCLRPSCGTTCCLSPEPRHNSRHWGSVAGNAFRFYLLPQSVIPPSLCAPRMLGPVLPIHQSPWSCSFLGHQSHPAAVPASKGAEMCQTSPQWLLRCLFKSLLVFTFCILSACY